MVWPTSREQLGAFCRVWPMVSPLAKLQVLLRATYGVVGGSREIHIKTPLFLMVNHLSMLKLLAVDQSIWIYDYNQQDWLS